MLLRRAAAPWFLCVSASRLTFKNLLKTLERFTSHIIVLQRTRWRVRQPESVVGTNFEELLMRGEGNWPA